MHYRAPSVSPWTCSQGMKGWSREWSMSSSAGMQARLRALRCLQILSTGADNIKRLLRQELLIWLPEFTTVSQKRLLRQPPPQSDCGLDLCFKPKYNTKFESLRRRICLNIFFTQSPPIHENAWMSTSENHNNTPVPQNPSLGGMKSRITAYPPHISP